MSILHRIVQRVHRHGLYATGKGVSKSLTIVYDIRGTVTNTKTLQYDIRQLVGVTKTLQYDIKNTVSNTVTLQYDIRGLVSNTLQLIYDILSGTISGTSSQSSGQKLQTIDEPEDIRHFKRAITATTGFIWTAKLKKPETIHNRIQARLFYKFNTNSFQTTSEGLKKIQWVGAAKIPLRIEKEIPVNMEARLTTPQYTGHAEAKLDLTPAISILRRATEMILGKKTRTFVFNEVTNQPPIGGSQDQDRELIFQEPSSFVGKVTYNIDDQTMEIILNGKTYNYCRVPERIFDAFNGADSKGAYYNRIIKGQFNC